MNFNRLTKEEFRELEKSAYKGQLDFNEFPAAEYRYFDRVQSIGYRVRHEGLPKDLAKQERNRAYKDYLSDVDESMNGVRVYKQYCDAKIRLGELVALIYKSKSPMEKLRWALECVELAVGEDGLAARNLSENYLEVEENNG